MASDRTLQALLTGMSTEVWGQRFYQEAVARTASEAGQRVFASLVAEEGAHLEILMGQYAAVSAGGSFVSREEALRLAKSVKPADIFPKADDAGQLIGADVTDEGALQLAMDFERRGHDLYASWAGSAATPGERDVWEYLAKAEDQHYAYLDEAMSYLRSNGVWFYDEREKPFFEG